MRGSTTSSASSTSRATGAGSCSSRTSRSPGRSPRSALVLPSMCARASSSCPHGLRRERGCPTDEAALHGADHGRSRRRRAGRGLRRRQVHEQLEQQLQLGVVRRRNADGQPDAGQRPHVRDGHPQRRGLVLVRGQEGRPAGGEGRGREAHLEPVEQRPAEGGPAHRRRRLAEGRRPRGLGAERERDQGLAREGQGGRHPDHHAELRRGGLQGARGDHARGPDRDDCGQGGGRAAEVRRRQEGALRHPRAEQHRPAAALRRREAGLRRRGDQPPGQGHRGHRDHADRDQVQAAGGQVLRRRHLAEPGHRLRGQDRDHRRQLEREARDVRPQPVGAQGHPGGQGRVRRGPAAVPAGLSAGRVPEALQEQREHGRRRPAGADGARLRRQEQRRDGPEADRGRHAIATPRAPAPSAAAGAPASSHTRREMMDERAMATPTGTATPARDVAPPPPVPAGDERLAKIGPMARLLRRPEIGALLAAVVVAIFFWTQNSLFLKLDGISNWTDVASTIGIPAVVVALLMIGGEFDLSAGVMTGSAGLMMGILATELSMNVWPAIVLTLIAAGAVGFVNGYMVMATKLPSFIVTLATFFILQGVNLGVTKAITNQVAVSNIDSAAGYASANKIFGGSFSSHDFRISVLWWIAITVIATWILSRTRVGNWIFGVGGDANAARNTGVPVARVKIGLFVTTSLVCALTGIMIALRLASTQAGQGVGDEFQYIIAAVVGGCVLTGGFGSAIGASLGATIIGMAFIGIQFSGWNTDWRFLFLGVILLAAVLVNNYIRKRAEGARR